jgi:hypothetical protein
MTTPSRASSRRRFLAGSLATLASSGCLPRRESRPVVVTSWTPEELTLVGLDQPLRVIRPPEHLSPLDLVSRGLEADIVIGGPIDAYRALAPSGLFRDLPAGPFQVARRASVALLALPGAVEPPTTGSLNWATLEESRWDGRYVLASPRHDLFTQAAVCSHIRANPFAGAYADLVLAFARAPSLARSVRAGLSFAQRNRVPYVLAPDALGAAFDLSAYRFASPQPDFDEGLAVLASSRAANAAVQLHDTLGPTAIEASAAIDPRETSLLALLLGSTLVAPHRELRHAIRALDAAEKDRPSAARRARTWLVEPPPWPPASMLRLRARSGGRRLLEQLAEQIAPDPGTHVAFLELMSAPASLIDLKAFSIIVASAGGLTASPRFLAWLEAEWTAWAGQRYRRCARLAHDGDSHLGEVPQA